MSVVETKCPDCGKIFHIVLHDPIYYENLVAHWVHGELAPPRNPGYDVITKIFGKDITIQVKHSSQSNRGHKANAWRFDHTISRVLPDFYVLFGIRDYGDAVFLLDYREFISRATKNVCTNGALRYHLSMGISKDSFSWNYFVHEPEKYLLYKIKAMIADRQLGLWQ